MLSCWLIGSGRGMSGANDLEKGSKNVLKGKINGGFFRQVLDLFGDFKCYSTSREAITTCFPPLAWSRELRFKRLKKLKNIKILKNLKIKAEGLCWARKGKKWLLLDQKGAVMSKFDDLKLLKFYQGTDSGRSHKQTEGMKKGIKKSLKPPGIIIKQFSRCWSDPTEITTIWCKMPWKTKLRLTPTQFIYYLFKKTPQNPSRPPKSTKIENHPKSQLCLSTRIYNFWNIDSHLWRCWNGLFWQASHLQTHQNDQEGQPRFLTLHHFERRFKPLETVLRAQPDRLLTGCRFDDFRLMISGHRTWICNISHLNSLRLPPFYYKPKFVELSRFWRRYLQQMWDFSMEPLRARWSFKRREKDNFVGIELNGAGRGPSGNLEGRLGAGTRYLSLRQFWRLFGVKWRFRRRMRMRRARRRRRWLAGHQSGVLYTLKRGRVVPSKWQNPNLKYFTEMGSSGNRADSGHGMEDSGRRRVLVKDYSQIESFGDLSKAENPHRPFINHRSLTIRYLGSRDRFGGRDGRRRRGRGRWRPRWTDKHGFIYKRVLWRFPIRYRFRGIRIRLNQRGRLAVKVRRSTNRRSRSSDYVLMSIEYFLRNFAAKTPQEIQRPFNPNLSN